MDLSGIFINQYSEFLIFILIAVTVFCVLWVLINISQQLFKAYQRRMYLQVDKGLRDVLVMLNPEQIVTFTLVAVLIIVPIVFVFTNVVFSVIVGVIILITPTAILRVMKKRRTDEFVSQLPDALSALSSSLRSGMNLIKSFQQVVKNQPNPLAQEFSQVLVEYRVGTDLNDSLDELSRRIDRQDVLLMNSAIKISRTVGGNLADTLDTLSRTLREKSKVEGKILALTSMGKSQGIMATLFPVVIGYMFYKIEPEATSLLFTTQLGFIFLGLMVALMITAYFVIQKIVDVDI